MTAELPPGVVSFDTAQRRCSAAGSNVKRLSAPLVMALWLCTPYALHAAEPKPPRGWIDRVDVTSVQGWACQPDAPGAALWIHLYATGTNGNGTCHDEGTDRVCYVGGGPAIHSRGDLAATDCGGLREHGFMIPTPGYLLDGQEHRVYASAINVFGGTNRVLSGSPRTLEAAPLSDIAPPLFTQPAIAANELDRWIRQPGCEKEFKVDYNIAKIYSSHSAICPSQYSIPVPWSVANFTSFLVPEPITNFQRGVSNTWYGSDAIQAHGTTIGVHHHPESAGELGREGFHTVALIYNWWTDRDQPVTAVRPWQDTNQRRIRFEGWVRAPRADRVRAPDEKSETAAYLSFVLKFNSVTHPSSHLSVTVSIFDLDRCGEGVTRERSDRDQQIQWDAGPWSIPIAHSFIHPTSVLVTKVPGSHDTTCERFGATEERYFAFDLNGDQFEDIIRRIQRKFPAVFPDLARDYYLNHINVQNEIFISGASSRAWLSTAYRNIRIRLLGVN